MSISAPRLSDRAVAYLEQFATDRGDTALRLKLDQTLCCGEGEDAITYDGPHLSVCGETGLYGSASVADPVSVGVGSRSFVMSAADMQAVGGRYVELIPVQSSSGSFMYVLAIV